MFQAGTARLFPILTVAQTMDSRIDLNPAVTTMEHYRAIIELANHVMGNNGDYSTFGIVGTEKTSVHITAARDAVRQQHPDLLADLQAFLEKHDIRTRSIVDRRGIQADAAIIMEEIGALGTVHGSLIAIEAVEPDRIEALVLGAKELLDAQKQKRLRHSATLNAK
jgi:hypothetical protein